MPIAQLLLCQFLQSFPPGGLWLSHFPRQLALLSIQRSGSRRIPATPADGYFREKIARKHFWFVPERIYCFSLDAVVFLPDTICSSAWVYLGKLMLGRLIKAPDQLLHISEAVPAKQMNGNSAVYLSSFINDKGKLWSGNLVYCVCRFCFAEAWLGQQILLETGETVS